jgi:hypothetical protein
MPMQRRQRVAFERMLFDRDIVQAFATRGVGAPFAPGGEEIQPQAEAGFEDGEYARMRPSARQIVAPEEHMARLPGTGVRAVVHVAVGSEYNVPSLSKASSARAHACL